MKKLCKRLFALGLVLCLLLTLPVSTRATTVASGTSGSTTWSLDDTGCLTITGTGAMADYTSGSKTPWYSYMRQIRSVVIGEGVTTVGSYAFSYFYNIETVSFPTTLISIGQEAFEMCGSLEEIVLPDSVTTLGQYAFFQCDDLERVVLSDNITTINNSTFFDCDDLKEIVLPANLKSIGDTAIADCDSLTSITLPASLTSLGVNSLSYNTGLLNIYLEEGNTTFKSVDGVLFSADGKKLYAYPGGRGGVYDVPDGTETIARGAFFSAVNMTGINFPDSLKTIEDSAFGLCSSLTEVDFNKVQTIGTQAFQGSSALKKIVFGEDVSSIGAQLFYRATNLAVEVNEIFFTGDAPTFVTDMYGYGPFRGVTATAYYPADNSTWTSAKLQSYSGTITWVAYDPNATTGSGTLDNGMTWELDESGTLTITGTGAMPDFEETPWDLLSLNVKSAVLSNGITSVGAYSFYGCSNMTGVTIPDSVTAVGEGAFADCTSLGQITLPEELESIGAYAFYSSGLTAIEIPNACLSLGENAFYKCGELAEIKLPEGLTEIPAECFADCDSLIQIDIPNTVTTIGDTAFYDCDALTEITLPSSLESCGDAILSRCVSLQNIHVSEDNTVFASVDGVLYSKDGTVLYNYPAGRSGAYAVEEGTESINFAAFAGCDKLTGLTFPDSLTELGLNAFWDCDALEEIELGGSLTTTGQYTFYGCDQLKKVVFGDNLTTVGRYAFAGCTALEEIELCGNITTVDYAAFYYCTMLNNIVFGDKVTTIGNYAFRSCTALEEVVLSDSVTSVGNGAFYGCNKLVKVVFGKSVSSVGSKALYFSNHDRTVKQIYFTGDAPTINSAAFQYIYADVYYPAGNSTWTSKISSSYGGYGIIWYAHTHSYDAIVTEPTCTEQGYTTHICVCGDSYVDSYVDALGHSYFEGICECGATCASIKFVGPSLNLESEIHYNFDFTLDDFGEVEIVEMGLLMFNTRTDDKKDSNYDTADECYIWDGTYASDGAYRFRSGGVPAKNMGDDGWYRIYVKLSDGSIAYSTRLKYSAKLYAQSALEGNYSDDLKALCVALMNYGAAAQQHFAADSNSDYTYDTLMNDFLTDEQKAMVSGYDASMIDDRLTVDKTKCGVFANSDNSVFPNGYNMYLSLLGAITLNIEVPYVADGVTEAGILVWSQADYLAAEELTWENATKVYTCEVDGILEADYTGIAAKNMGDTVFACGYVMIDGEYHYTSVFRTSVDNYASKSMVGTSTSETMKMLDQYLVVYGEYAKAYFA